MVSSSSEDRALIRDAAKGFLADQSTGADVRRVMAMDAGYDPAQWQKVAAELGWPGLLIPEAHGGLALGAADLAVLIEEMGAAMFCAPFFATSCLATPALVSMGTDALQAQWLPQLADGSVTAALAVAETGGGHDLADINCKARKDGANYVLSGTKRYVIDGASAGLLIVAARRPGTSGAAGISLFALPADTPGITRKALATLDQTRRLAEITFANAQVPADTLMGEEGHAGPALTRVLDFAITALAAEQAGGARRCLDLTVAYLKERVQFGKPLGTLQALKHRCADMMVQVESALVAAQRAADAADANDPEFPMLASLAKAYCSEAFYAVAADTIQLHGGMGFTWETDPHLYFKRARASAAILGDARYHRERIASGLGL
jgi:alkylation response protein AidB-like acyl-CoA dehydrogenase